MVSASPRWGRTLEGVSRWDLALGGLLLAVALADALTTADYAGGRTRLAVAAVLQTAPVVIRRTNPPLAVGISLLGVLVEVAGVRAYGGAYGLITFLVLVFSTARWGRGSARHTALALLICGAAAHVLSQRPDGPLGVLGNAVVVVLPASAVWLVGRALRTAERRVAAQEAERERLLEAERARISRELHDIVGHALAGISLTAGAAEPRAREADPQSASALSLIRTLSRDAAADVRRLVGLLREEGDVVAAREPRPTLEGVAALVERAREAGMEVGLRREGSPGDVPPGVQLAAHRVVQEGLTNVAKHASGARAEVTVRIVGDRLEVEVRDDGGDDASPGDGEGHGLLGLAERVRLYDGRLSAEPQDPGFRLLAVLPLPGGQ